MHINALTNFNSCALCHYENKRWSSAWTTARNCSFEAFYPCKTALLRKSTIRPQGLDFLQCFPGFRYWDICLSRAALLCSSESEAMILWRKITAVYWLFFSQLKEFNDCWSPFHRMRAWQADQQCPSWGNIEVKRGQSLRAERWLMTSQLRSQTLSGDWTDKITDTKRLNKFPSTPQTSGWRCLNLFSEFFWKVSV